LQGKVATLLVEVDFRRTIIVSPYFVVVSW